MNRLKTMVMLAAGFIAALLAPEAQAATTARLNIDVTIVANLSVSVNGVSSSTDPVQTWNVGTPNAKLTGSSATVTNDSGGQTEKWALSTTANTVPQSGGGSWTLATSTASVGVDEFAVQAVFGSSNTIAAGCPAGAATNWDQAHAVPLTTTPATYTSAVFADPTLNNLGGTPNPDVTAGGNNGRMFAGGKRALCWRVITPNSTSTIDTQNVQIIVTAQNP